MAANYSWTFTTGVVADTTAPTVGASGTLTTANIGATSLTLNWTKGTDAVSAASNLQYLVYYSTSNNLSTVANIEANGTAVGTYTTDIATKNITSLSGSTTYFFNVIVRDEAGNKAVYTTVTATTNPSVVTTPTFSPTAGHYNTAQNITISTTTASANIYYTTDGSTPTTSSTLYSTAVHIWSLAGKTVKAFATKAGFADSSVATLSGIFSYPPLKTGAGAISGYTLVTGEDGQTQTGVTRSYTDNGNGTVTDNATGLLWQKCFKGRNNDGTCSDDAGVADTATWADAGTYCTGLSLAGKTWRLPTRQELETLPDYSKSNPAIYTTVFPATVAGLYWSSTTYAAFTTGACYVHFGNGVVGSSDKTNNNYVRCVSGP